MQHHLAIFTQPWLDLILDGKKTIDSRFTKVRCAPYGKIKAGDLVYLKESSGSVKGQFTVAKVEVFADLTSETLYEIDARYRREIFADLPSQSFWEKWLVSKYATLIHTKNITAYQKPFRYPRKGRAAWMLLDGPIRQTIFSTVN